MPELSVNPPIPFHEITIPALRQHEYRSTLSELRQTATNQNFTTYLTSYNSDGLEINALLLKPTGEPPLGGWPTVVFVHGYIPPMTYETQEKYVDYVNYLARNGFVVLKIDLRGHGDSEGEATGSYYSAGYVIDTLNAVAALKTSDFVNKNAVGLWGHSMAGNIVMRSVAAQPTIPAVVIWAGAGYSYQDLRQYGLNDNSYRRPTPTSQPSSYRQRLFDVYGEFDAHNDFWKQVAPTNYLSDVKTAIQLHHAQDDTVVSIKYSEDLNAVLDKTSIDHEFYQYPSGGHNISGSNFSAAMRRTVEFYKKHLVE